MKELTNIELQPISANPKDDGYEYVFVVQGEAYEIIAKSLKEAQNKLIKAVK